MPDYQIVNGLKCPLNEKVVEKLPGQWENFTRYFADTIEKYY
jgi:hypothetical protein